MPIFMLNLNLTIVNQQPDVFTLYISLYLCKLIDLIVDFTNQQFTY
jgi:hypothetical protein